MHAPITWIAYLLAAFVLSAFSPVDVDDRAGDIDGDGDLDCADADLLIGTVFYGEQELPGMDLNGDGFVDQYDLSTWIELCDADPMCTAEIIAIEHPVICVGDILSVELTSFEGIAKGNEVTLLWETASESRNHGFSVEHRVGSDKFAEVGFVQGNGTSDTRRTYTYTVVDLPPGTHHFRLKQIDFDGAFQYSSVVESTLGVPGGFLVEPAFPNPFNPTTTLRFAVATPQHVEVTLFDTAAQLIGVLFSGTIGAGEMQEVIVDAMGLPTGTYLVHFETEAFTVTEPVVLVK